MKPLQISIITILTFTIFISINTVFGQVAPVLDLPHAFFKTDHEVYPIQYNITNGKLETTLVDLGARALIFIINATEDGQLSVELPRKIIDATRDGKDKPYFVGLGDPNTGLKRIKADEILTNNETRVLSINFTKGIREVEISGSYFVENNYPRSTINPYGEWSPLAQWQHGIYSEDVKCKENLQLIIKKSDETPACVRYETAVKLVSRGWTDSFWISAGGEVTPSH